MSLVGTAAGVGVSWLIGPRPLHVMLALVPLASLSLYATWRSSRLVVLRSLNLQRAELAIRSMLEQLSGEQRAGEQRAGEQRAGEQRAGEQRAGERRAAAEGAAAEGAAAEGAAEDRTAGARPLVAPRPEAIADLESFILPYSSVFDTPLLLQPLVNPLVNPGGPKKGLTALGASISQRLGLSTLRVEHAAALALVENRGGAGGGRVASGRRTTESQWESSWHAGGLYAIAFRRASGEPKGAGGGAGGATLEPSLVLWYASHAQPRDKVRAMWHACLLRRRMAAAASAEAASAEPAAQPADDVERWHMQAEESWPHAQAAFEAAGWDLRSTYIDGDEGCLALENDYDDI